MEEQAHSTRLVLFVPKEREGGEVTDNIVACIEKSKSQNLLRQGWNVDTFPSLTNEDGLPRIYIGVPC